MGSRLTDGLSQLRRDYANRLDATMNLITREWTRWQTGDRNGGLRLRREIHRLYGSGATFGFIEISTIAGEIEALLDRGLAAPTLDPDIAEAITDRIGKLEKIAAPIAMPARRRTRYQPADRPAAPDSRG